MNGTSLPEAHRDPPTVFSPYSQGKGLKPGSLPPSPCEKQHKRDHRQLSMLKHVAQSKSGVRLEGRWCYLSQGTAG